MSVQEIKEKLASLPRKEQDEVAAFLFHLRHGEDGDYRKDVGRRMDDREPSHWISPEEFEKQLDKK
ncbi:MAG TPA: hypothetical protein VK615_05120 [Candidatus Binatia bacterium]|nr:hypothetical protein [Candidatus Binatia bacterium]